MKDLMMTGGNTPFEQAAARHKRGSQRVSIMIACDHICTLIEECNVMINTWRDEVDEKGVASAETRMLAAEALKDKQTAEAALDELMKRAEELGFVN